MKQILAFVVLALSVVVARADFVIQQKVESAEQNGIITLKFKGDQLRTDMPTERVGDVSIIRDLKTGDTITMIHRQKLARKESGAEYKQRLEQMDNGTPDTVISKPVDTGKMERVGNYDTEIYTWTNSSHMGGTFWLARDYPDYPKIRSLYLKLEQPPAGQISKRTAPDISALPGMVVKSKSESPTGEITKTLISAKEEPVAASDFQIPADYRVLGLVVTPGHPISPPNH
ncbi:MAG: DUF4412 domain-containing protein [Verrucomicrobiota bacterium]|jgi:hypothetical protein